MITAPWYWLIAFILLIAAFLIEIDCIVKNCGKPKPYLWSSLATLLYTISIVTAILWFGGVNIYFIRSGTATCITITLLAGIHLADILISRGKK